MCDLSEIASCATYMTDAPQSRWSAFGLQGLSVDLGSYQRDWISNPPLDDDMAIFEKLGEAFIEMAPGIADRALEGVPYADGGLQYLTAAALAVRGAHRVVSPLGMFEDGWSLSDLSEEETCSDRADVAAALEIAARIGPHHPAAAEFLAAWAMGGPDAGLVAARMDPRQLSMF